MKTRCRLSVSFVVIALLATVLAMGALPSAAITYGQLDREHTNVGAILVLFPDGSLRRWCSGTLVHPRVFLTAGHCTDALVRYGIDPKNLRVSFSDFLYDAPWYNVSAYITHPDYWWGPTSDPHDVAILVLAEPITDRLPAILAPIGYLNTLASEGKLSDARFTNVGYGQNEDFVTTGWRQVSYSGFLSLHNAWLYMSQNNRTGNGGTCYGDSGGPTFYKEGNVKYLVAITSWGDAMCVATNINYRIDIESSQSFIDSVVAVVDGA